MNNIKKNIFINNSGVCLYPHSKYVSFLRIWCLFSRSKLFSHSKLFSYSFSLRKRGFHCLFGIGKSLSVSISISLSISITCLFISLPTFFNSFNSFNRFKCFKCFNCVDSVSRFILLLLRHDDHSTDFVFRSVMIRFKGDDSYLGHRCYSTKVVSVDSSDHNNGEMRVGSSKGMRKFVGVDLNKKMINKYKFRICNSIVNSPLILLAQNNFYPDLSITSLPKRGVNKHPAIYLSFS